MTRYARQQILPEVGAAGQEKLASAHILVVGAGGLGCPALQYLVGAGIGTITIIDPDVVDRSNLHRQPLYGESSLGQPKAEAARLVLANLNPDVTIAARVERLQPANAHPLVEAADVVLDCADSYAASYILSDTCGPAHTPLISASVLGLSGYVGGFCGGAPSLRAVFPDLPKSLATCATAGVLGPAVGTLGCLQAQMALSVLLGLKPSPLGHMVSVKLDTYTFSTFRFDGAPEPTSTPFPFIGPTDVTANDLIVELRDEEEAPVPVHPAAVRATDHTFQTQAMTPGDGQRAVMCCRSGLRAWRAASALRQYWSGPVALVAAGDVIAAE